MFYVCLDIHSKHLAMCVLDENGKVFRRAKFSTIHETLDSLERLPDRFEVCYEASCGYGFYHDALRPLAARIVVAHPGHLRLIFRSKHKNDRQDAEKLAKLLFLGEVPAVHVPGVEVRSWRELITCRRHLVGTIWRRCACDRHKRHLIFLHHGRLRGVDIGHAPAASVERQAAAFV